MAETGDIGAATGLTPAEIIRLPRFAAAVQRQAARLLAIHAANPRPASVFATQHRWLIAHATLARYFRGATANPPERFGTGAFLDDVVAHAIASRNTADAFLKEMQKYGYLVIGTPGPDRRVRLLEPSKLSVELICAWLATHLATLDELDGGGREHAFLARPAMIAQVQPLVADGLLRSPKIREPDPTFSLFTWLNEGGIVMDWLCAGLGEAEPASRRIPTKVSSLAELRERITLSRTHFGRKLRMAEEMGSLGWFGERGKSPMWVSAEFVQEYYEQQATKLAIVDGAFRAAMTVAPTAVAAIAPN